MKNNSWLGTGIIESKKTIQIKDPRGDYEVTDLLISVEREIKGNLKVTMVPVECWGEKSIQCDEFQKGDLVKVHGHFENKKWKNKQKVEVSKNLIVLEKIEKA